MRSSIACVSLFAFILPSIRLAQATPYPREDFLDERSQNGTFELEKRCTNPCGLGGAYCCASDQYCTTSNAIALCLAAAATGGGGGGGGQGYEIFTTTYTLDEVVTSTWTELVGTPTLPPVIQTPAPAPVQSLICNVNLGQANCGSICCASTQVCAYLGQCMDHTTAYIVPTMTPSVSNSAFIRPTSNTVETVTSTAAATTTIPFAPPVNSQGSTVTASPVNSGLSGGAIAGIVIGVLVGLFLLFLLLACLCCKGIFDTLAAIFGRKRRTEVTETYVGTHHSSGGGRPPRRTWFGAGPARPDRPEKKSSGLGGLLGVGAVLTALAIILGLKRRRDRRSEKASSYGSSVSYDYSDYTTESSLSSDDRRTRNSRHSRVSRHSRR